MLRAYALTVLLVPAAFAQEAKAPARLPSMTPGVSPVVSPSLPLTPVNTAGLGELLRKAAANALGYGQTSVIPGGMALGFAPQANDTQKPAPPSLPNSALSPTSKSGLSPVTPNAGTAAAPQAQGPGLQSPSRVEGKPGALPGMLPLVFEASHGLHAVYQTGKTIEAKTEALKQPLETASGLSVAGAGRGSEEAAKRLGDGIWDVMMDERSGGSGQAKSSLRDAMGSTGGNVSGGAHAGALAGEERAVMEALDYSALSGGPSAAAFAARSVYGAPVEGATVFVAPGGDAFLIEAADAAETARRYARENLTAEQGAASGKALKSGPIEKVWLQAFDSVLKLFSSTYGVAELKPGWYAKPNARPEGLRYGSLPLAVRQDGVVTGGGTGVTIVPASGRLVSRLAAQSAAKDAPVLGPGKGFTVPNAKSIPDHLLVLSLLPLAALALAYLREFKR